MQATRPVTETEQTAYETVKTAQSEGLDSAIDKLIQSPSVDQQTKEWLRLGKIYANETKKSFRKALTWILVVIVLILVLLIGVVAATSVTAKRTPVPT